MKSSSIEYTKSLNNGYVSVLSHEEGYYDFKEIKSYMGTELEFVSSDELIELGEWFIALGQGEN
jgi:hypothetical protein